MAQFLSLCIGLEHNLATKDKDFHRDVLILSRQQCRLEFSRMHATAKLCKRTAALGERR